MYQYNMAIYIKFPQNIMYRAWIIALDSIKNFQISRYYIIDV